jgi:hypothetical protein
MAATQAQEVSLQVTAGAIATAVADRQTYHARLANGLPQVAGGQGTRPPHRERPAQIRDRPRWCRNRNTAMKGHVR